MRIRKLATILALAAGLAGCSAPRYGLGNGPFDSDGGYATDGAYAPDGSTEPDAGPGDVDGGDVDAPTTPDAGAPDSGSTPDAGDPPDGGPDVDAGVPDSGSTPDAGTTCPGGAAIDGHCYVAAPWDGLTGGACPAGSALVWWTDSAGEDRAAAAITALGITSAGTDLIWVSSWTWAHHATTFPTIRWAVAPRATDHAAWLEADGMHASYRSDVSYLLCEVSP